MSHRTLANTRETATLSSTLVARGILQRTCACDRHTIASGECRECSSNRQSLQRRAAIDRDVSGAPPIVYDVLRSPGQPLDQETRAFFEPRFGHDFSQVRVHTDARAAESAHKVNALAYTVGQDVVFGAGQYTPATNEGLKLMAHELTHIVQQQHAKPMNFHIAPPDAFEEEANSVARAFSANAVRVHDTLAPFALHRQPAPPKEDQKKPGEKAATSQPAPQKIPALEIRKQHVKTTTPEKAKEGVEATASLGTETEIKRGEQGATAEAADKFELEVAIPITDKLRVGPISFLKEVSVAGSLGFPPARLYPKPLSSLELETSVKALSLDFENVKVPLGVADFGISGSALASAGYNVAEGKSEFKAGIAGEAEAKFKPREKRSFFITAKFGVEETFDKEGNANFKWSPVTWKSYLGVGFEL